MAINKVNTTAEEKSFKFLTNQSTILRTAETNNITINGVNVIVEKPKVGDVMCVTKYKNNSGTLLGADKQKVIWIDGLSINPDQLSEELEPVGICMVVNGNKALVKYREESQVLEFSSMPGTLMELPDSSYMNDNTEHRFAISINNNISYWNFTASDTSSRYNFVQSLNRFFNTYSSQYVAQLVELDSEIPVSPEDSDKPRDGGYYTNRVIITSYATTNEFNIQSIGDVKDVEIQGVKENSHIYKKNGFDSYFNPPNNSYSGKIGCCFSTYYRYYASYGAYPYESELTSINIGPVSYDYFEASSYKDSTYYSPILHNTFANYEDYIDSFMIKYPCGAGGIVADDPSGKESTYKLGNSTLFTYNGSSYYLYPAAYYATNISVNAPNLGKGNWWIPSVSEMAQMMRDINFNGNVDECDIVNTVINKIKNASYLNYGWDNFYPDKSRWTSSFYENSYMIRYSYMYFYDGNLASSGYEGCINKIPLSLRQKYAVTPITIYEF